MLSSSFMQVCDGYMKVCYFTLFPKTYFAGPLRED